MGVKTGYNVPALQIDCRNLFTLTMQRLHIYMEKKDPIPWGDVIHYLRTAALYPQRRGETIARALQELLVCLSAVGTALVWPCQDRNVPWKIYYVGTRQESMRRWLAARLDFSLDATLGVLQQDLSKLSDMPFPQIICLQPAPMFPASLWLIWTSLSSLSGPINDCVEEVRQTLEALIEVESSEPYYFSSASPLSDRALIEALGQGDPHAISVLLGLTRLIGNADLTFWGRVYQDVVETRDHVGAKHNGFGFVLPRGQGMGGRVAASGNPILIEDYRNSPYRHPSVADIVDSEQLRSGIALPVHARIGQEGSKHVSGVLYAARRTVKPFSLAEQLLMQRMILLLEPLHPPTRPSSFLAPGLKPISEEKTAWHKLVLQANHIENLERWVSQFIKGTIIVTDNDGRPYVSTRAEQLERLRTAFERSIDGVQLISLGTPDLALPGQVYLRSAIALPPRSWPDFFTDLVMACNLIIGRMEQACDHLARQREQWLHIVLQEKSIPQIRQDGYRLGLPVEKGQIWVVAWPTQRMLSKKSVRQRMLVENIVLDQLKSPLLFFGDDIGVILLDKDTELQPSRLRETLLTQFAPHPLWIVYGARYHSPHDLKAMLTHCISQAQKARREAHSEYLLNVQTPGLESLLANPRLTEDLRTFATELLTPLLEYDRSKGTDLTTTFVLAQTLGSTQTVSDELGVHVSTIRYRLRKAEEILGIEEASPEERNSLRLASSIWMRFHPLE
jgi:sugar diacid utilization regulator